MSTHWRARADVLAQNFAGCLNLLYGPGSPSPTLTAIHRPQSPYVRIHLLNAGTTVPVDKAVAPEGPLYVLTGGGLRVDPAMRRRGLGGKYYNALKTAAFTVGIDRIDVDVDQDGRFVWPKVLPEMRWGEGRTESALAVIQFAINQLHSPTVAGLGPRPELVRPARQIIRSRIGFEPFRRRLNRQLVPNRRYSRALTEAQLRARLPPGVLVGLQHHGAPVGEILLRYSPKEWTGWVWNPASPFAPAPPGS